MKYDQQSEIKDVEIYKKKIISEIISATDFFNLFEKDKKRESLNQNNKIDSLNKIIII